MILEISRILLEMQPLAIKAIEHIKGAHDHTPYLLPRLCHMPKKTTIVINSIQDTFKVKQDFTTWIYKIKQQPQVNTAIVRVLKSSNQPFLRFTQFN